jgi:capsular exopolysaccharide synthesis family protein
VSYIYEALQRVEEERKAARGVLSSGGNGAVAAGDGDGAELMRVLRGLEPEAVPPPEPRVAQAAPAFERVEIAGVPENSRLVTITDPSGLGAEKFRMLATRLKNLQQKRSLKRLLITSSIVQEGKSLVSSNLAVTLARHGLQRVLLIDGDLRKPVLGTRFGIRERRGLTEFLLGNEPAGKFVYNLEALNIHIMPAGAMPENPLELLQTPKLRGLIDRMSGLFDWVVIDSPPLVPVADANVWGRLSDGMLLVTRQGVTERKMLEKGLKPVDRPALLGVVFNGSTDAHHHYYYYSPSGPGQAKPARKGSPGKPLS